MGYYSDIRCTMSVLAFNELRGFVDKVLEEAKKDYILLNPLRHTDVFRDDFGDGKEKFVYFGWYSIKWYTSNIEINAVLNGLDFIDSKGFSFCFVRLGEDIEDNEWMENNGNDDLIVYPLINRSFDDKNLWFG